MSFTTLAFAIFLIIVFAVYSIALRFSYKAQNAWLLIAGYVFYGWWDWRFLGLLLATTIVSWACALPLKHRKGLATVSIVFNLLVLCIFKYFDFFGKGLVNLVAAFGGQIDWFTIDVLLPVGISFYTFQAIGYSIDVYKKRIPATKDFITYSVYIAFFPQLVAGPIERPENLIPQFERPRRWDYPEAVLGMRQILWGLFKKCVVADGVAFWVRNGFDFHAEDGTLYGNFQCFLAVIGFALQVYGDFSGYSDIARGTARLFGIKLMNNFLFPFFSRNALELWQRWHRSLMQWFTEYLYKPLGGSRNGRTIMNLMIVFLVSGLWHGADVTFILWGAICGIWYIIAMKCGAERYRPGKSALATRNDLVKMATTFFLFALSCISFRANDLENAFLMSENILWPGIPIMALCVFIAWCVQAFKVRFSTLLYILTAITLTLFILFPANTVRYGMGFAGYVFGAVMIFAEWKRRMYSFALERMSDRRWVRITIYSLLYIVVFSFAVHTENSDFLYFQF